MSFAEGPAVKHNSTRTKILMDLQTDNQTIHNKLDDLADNVGYMTQVLQDLVDANAAKTPDYSVASDDGKSEDEASEETLDTSDVILLLTSSDFEKWSTDFATMLQKHDFISLGSVLTDTNWAEENDAIVRRAILATLTPSIEESVKHYVKGYDIVEELDRRFGPTGAHVDAFNNIVGRDAWHPFRLFKSREQLVVPFLLSIEQGDDLRAKEWARDTRGAIIAEGAFTDDYMPLYMVQDSFVNKFSRDNMRGVHHADSCSCGASQEEWGTDAAVPHNDTCGIVTEGRWGDPTAWADNDQNVNKEEDTHAGSETGRDDDQTGQSWNDCDVHSSPEEWSKPAGGSEATRAGEWDIDPANDHSKANSNNGWACQPAGFSNETNRNGEWDVQSAGGANAATHQREWDQPNGIKSGWSTPDISPVDSTRTTANQDWSDDSQSWDSCSELDQACGLQQSDAETETEGRDDSQSFQYRYDSETEEYQGENASDWESAHTRAESSVSSRGRGGYRGANRENTRGGRGTYRTSSRESAQSDADDSSTYGESVSGRGRGGHHVNNRGSTSARGRGGHYASSRADDSATNSVRGRGGHRTNNRGSTSARGRGRGGHYTSSRADKDENEWQGFTAETNYYGHDPAQINDQW
ncbi:hypothetical protein F5Y17DRAFT_458439 [Xylariaceae sp. FL0594]|nr:hypothetical protein F5Y17DRAFT_458439 [Xylariaceae sp. FL0594]